MEKKQTAVDWYFDKIKSHFEHDGDLFEVACFTYAIAKQKEKEQIIDAHIEGQRVFDKHQHTQWTNDQAEQYYNQTYGD